MKLYGLIGYPLGHSFSERYFKEKFARESISGCDYHLFPLESIDSLPSLLAENPELCGLNVTIPYKQSVRQYLDHANPEAESIGAYNCIRIENGELTGYNTDAYGFRESLLKLLRTERPAALVLGTGGASKAVCHVLKALGIDYTSASRNPGQDMLSYEEIGDDLIKRHKLIINTTPLGMFPDVENRPNIPYLSIGKGHFLYDLIYNPAETSFLKRGRKQGAATMNGEAMLELQADKSWEIWNRGR